MTNFYTNVQFYKGKILVRGHNDSRVHKIEQFSPYLFVPTQEESKYKTIYGQAVERKDFTTTTEARNFINQYKDISGFKVYGMTQWVYPYIYENYAKEASPEYDRSKIRIAYLDIETETGIYQDNHIVRIRKTERHEVFSVRLDELYQFPDYEIFDEEKETWIKILSSCYILNTEFPNIREADKEINSITVHFNGRNIVLGFYDFIPENKKTTTFIKCENERELLLKFISILQEIDPDIVTGWYCTSFDFPYITNRCQRILGEQKTKDLSPWGIIEKKTITNNYGREEEQAIWLGYSLIDYIDTYKKFESATEEMYSLDYISNKQLGVGKIDYSEYVNLKGLYTLNKQLYYHYNVIDVERIIQIEEKIKLFDVQLSLAYYMGSNYIDVFGTVRPWDAFIHAFLMRQGIVVPPNEIEEYNNQIEGAYVKQPKPNLYNWVVSFDVKSLYPSLARQCNISPETIIGTIPRITVQDILKRAIDPKIIQQIKDENVSLCGTGCIFDNSVEGFIAACMRLTYEERVKFQAQHKKYKKQLSEIEQEMLKRGLKVD